MRYKNNPANIRFNVKNHWKGLLANDNGFCAFDSIEHGLRALILLLKRYINVYKLTSVQGIIERFAPACENDTRNYVSFVSGFLRKHGFDPDNVTFTPDCIYTLVVAICKIETSTDVSIYANYLIVKVKSLIVKSKILSYE